MTDFEFRWIVNIYEREEPEFIGYEYKYKGEKDGIRLYLVTIFARDWENANYIHEQAEKDIKRKYVESTRKALDEIGGGKKDFPF